MSPTPETPDQARDEGVAKIAELIEDVKVCMLTTKDAAGRFVSRPMAVQEVEFDGDLWFFSNEHGRKVEQVRHDPGVGIAFSSRDSWVSVAGDAEIVRDVAKAKELWSKSVEAWFPDGPESSDLVLLKVHAVSAEYWDSPGSATASALSFVKARVTGKPYSGGENETVDL